MITDPGVPFGGAATLGLAADGGQLGSPPTAAGGAHAATAALFGHYIAGTLIGASSAYGGGLSVEAAASAGQHAHLTPPHHA